MRTVNLLCVHVSGFFQSPDCSIEANGYQSVGQHSWHEISTGEMGFGIQHLDANYVNYQQMKTADLLQQAW